MLVISGWYLAMQVPVTNPGSENILHHPAIDRLRVVALLMVFCSQYLKTPRITRGGGGGLFLGLSDSSLQASCSVRGTELTGSIHLFCPTLRFLRCTMAC